jgi:hypothetical protein
MAQNPDSLYFEQASVFFEYWDGTFIYKTVELQLTDEVVKDPGIFFSGYSLWYKTTEPLPGSLRLRIWIPEIKTDVIGYIRPLGFPVFTAPDTTRPKILSFFETEPVWIEWSGVAGVSETTIRLNYLNVTDNEVDTCCLDWLRHGCYMALMPNDYLEFISNWLSTGPPVRYRVVLGIDLLVASGDGAVANYLTYKDWGIDIIEKPYSNLYNAYGFVGSRIKGSLTGYLPNEKFMDSLANGKITKHLKFKKYTGGLPQASLY